MKKIVFLSFIGLFFISLTYAQERCEAPIFNVGSKWVIKADNGWEFVSELIGEEKDAYVFTRVIPEGRRKGEYRTYYNKKNMNVFKVIKDGTEDKEARDMFRKRYDFPLFQGKKWNYRFTVFSESSRRDVDILSELSVVGLEEIEVPAGKFKTYKIRVKNSTIGTGRDVSGNSYYWYSPEAKVNVKEVWEPGDYWREREYWKTELVFFELK